MKHFVFYDTNSGDIIDSQSDLFQWLFKGKRIDGYEMRAVNKKNSNEWIGYFTIVPVLDQKSQNTLYSIISITNITKSKKLEQELRLNANQLASTNKELESFSYSVSHDLRAPLRAIIGFSSFLIEDYIDKFDNEGKDYLLRIKKAGEKMNDLIDDLLNLAKITKQDMLIKNVNLTELAEAIFAEIRQSNPERDVTIKIEKDLQARGDERLLRIALVNLLRNAWKYTGKRTQAVIEFLSKVKQGKRIFIICDNGVGFDMNQSKELFTPFKRLHAESDFPGTGVGLAIVNKVITRHGGRIWAEAQVDKGASFFFTLN
jgi:signal transduction histidine kinase